MTRFNVHIGDQEERRLLEERGMMKPAEKPMELRDLTPAERRVVREWIESGCYDDGAIFIAEYRMRSEAPKPGME